MAPRLLVKAGPERDALVHQLVKEKVPIKEIAGRLGMLRQSVHVYLHRLGIDTQKLRETVLLDLLERDASDVEIADALAIGGMSGHGSSAASTQYRVPATTSTLALYQRCMADDPDWLNIAERRRDQRIRCVLGELRAELRTTKNRAAVRLAIKLWEGQESVGPRAQEIVQRDKSSGRRSARRRAA